MKAISYRAARLLSFSICILLVLIFCGAMILGLDGRIDRTELIQEKTRLHSRALEEVYKLHRHLKSSLTPARLEGIPTAEATIQQVVAELERIEGRKEDALHGNYFALQVLLNALSEELRENAHSDSVAELEQAIAIYLNRSTDAIVASMGEHRSVLLDAGERSVSLFVQLKSYMLNFAIAMIAILLLSSFYLNRILRDPVRRLAEAAAQVRQGNLEYLLEVKGLPRDELGRLMRDFNSMTRRLANTAGRLEKANKILQAESDELISLSEQKTRFIRHLGHELRAPLSSIIGFAELMEEGYCGDITEKQEDYLGRIGRRSPELGTLNLSCDEGRLRQVLINLLSNALKFSTDGDRVKVSLEKKGDRARIAVADSGMGIAPEDLEEIFREFHQGQTVKKSEGAGLGLPLSRQLVRLHKGDIEVSSVLGEGSEFTVVLPLE
jgi:signal transduction histidine kinase